jgi:hypothetical protein
MLEAEIFGTDDPVEVGDALASLARAVVGADVRAARWYISSVAAVAGVTLTDGTDAVVRAYQPSTSRTFVEAVVRVQAHLAGGGFPCARPVGVPVVVDGVLGRMETMLTDPGSRSFAPDDMAVSAAGLADVVRRCESLDASGLGLHPMDLPDDALYPSPHSPMFDFDATSDGAAWIDDIAMAARAAMTSDAPLISHGDWSARNVRIGPDGLCAVFDLESLQYGPESSALGVAAATWRAVGEAREDPAPDAAEIRSYIDRYQAARGRPLTDDQRRNARATAVYCLAYTARCEHALDPGTRTGRASWRLSRDDGLRSLLDET